MNKFLKLKKKNLQYLVIPNLQISKDMAYVFVYVCIHNIY